MPTLETPTHHIKIRYAGKKRFAFLSRKGSNRLRIHALQFTHDQAKKSLKMLQEDNPEHEFKIVPIHRGSK